MSRAIDAVLGDDDTEFDHVVVARIPRVPQALRDEHAALEAKLPTLTSDTIDAHPELHATAKRIEEIEAEIAASAIEIELRGIGYRAWADLIRKHPPTEAQRKIDRNAPWNIETFPDAAIAASCVVPTTVDDVVELTRRSWFTVECENLLWDACLRANVVDPAPKSVAAGLIRRLNGVSVKRLTTTESLDLSSLDE